MKSELQEAAKLTIFIGGDERREHRPLHDAVMELLRAAGVTGATAFKGVMGYGQSKLLHFNMNEITMENLPLVIEVVDVGERLKRVAPEISLLLGEHGLVQLQRTFVCKRTPPEDEGGAS